MPTSGWTESVSPYTSRSISRSVASVCGVALEHGLDVRRLLGGELPVQVQHRLDQGNHPVVPRNIGGRGEVDGADGVDSAQELIHR